MFVLTDDAQNVSTGANACREEHSCRAFRSMSLAVDENGGVWRTIMSSESGAEIQSLYKWDHKGVASTGCPA